MFSIRSLSALRLGAYVNHSTGLVPVIHCRKLRVPCLLFIDDRMLSEWLASFGDKTAQGFWHV